MCATIGVIVAGNRPSSPIFLAARYSTEVTTRSTGRQIHRRRREHAEALRPIRDGCRSEPETVTFRYLLQDTPNNGIVAFCYLQSPTIMNSGFTSQHLLIKRSASASFINIGERNGEV